MLRPPPRTPRPYTLFPYTTRFRSGLASACAATEARVAGSRFHGIIFLPHRRPNSASVFTLTRCPFIVHGRSITCKRLITASCHFAWLRFNRSEEHTSELQSLMRISYAVFCLKKKTNYKHATNKLY